MPIPREAETIIGPLKHMPSTPHFPCSPLLRRLRDKKGQTLVEYALILAFISIVSISVLISMSGQVRGTFTTIERQVAIAGNGGPVVVPPGH
jgi:Flp pilus assembly pilin Flp